MKSILGYTRTSLDTFDERPFCQVDSLVFSSIAYTFFPKEILPEGDWNGIHFADLLKAECFEQNWTGHFYNNWLFITIHSSSKVWSNKEIRT